VAEPTPLNTQADRIAAAKRAQADREKGIHANAVKQGRTLERADVLKALGAQTLADASQTAQLRAERDARPTADAMAHAKKAAHRAGVVWGLAYGFAACLVVGALWMLIGAEMFGRNATTGSMIARQADNVDALEALDGPNGN
jgi:hypothetical protein